MFTDRLVINASLIKKARTRLSERGFEVTPAEFIMLLHTAFKDLQIKLYNETGKIITKEKLLEDLLQTFE